MIVYAVIATDSVAARGLVNGWCLPRSGRRDILSVAITAFIFIRVILRIIVLIYHKFRKWFQNKKLFLHPLLTRKLHGLFFADRLRDLQSAVNRRRRKPYAAQAVYCHAKEKQELL